jgi:hypothetical protein
MYFFTIKALIYANKHKFSLGWGPLSLHGKMGLNLKLAKGIFKNRKFEIKKNKL